MYTVASFRKGKQGPVIDTARNIGRRFFQQENAVLITILAGMLIVMGIVSNGATLTKGNLSNIWLQSSTRGIAAIGETFVILTAGIDIAVGGLALMVAVLGASIMSGETGSIPLAIVAMLLLGIGIGALNGVLTARVPMPALIVTLGMWRITTGGAYLICRGITIRHLPESIGLIGAGKIAGMPIPGVIFAIVAAVSYFVLYYTPYGRAVYAVGGDPIAARLCGLRVPNITFSVYIISGMLAALCGLILMSRTMSGGMNTVTGLELDCIAATVIGGISLMGGRGSLIGTIIGVFIMGVINNGMNVFALNPAFHDVVKGAIIIIAVAFDYWRRRS